MNNKQDSRHAAGSTHDPTEFLTNPFLQMQPPPTAHILIHVGEAGDVQVLWQPSFPQAENISLAPVHVAAVDKKNYKLKQ